MTRLPAQPRPNGPQRLGVAHTRRSKRAAPASTAQIATADERHARLVNALEEVMRAVGHEPTKHRHLRKTAERHAHVLRHTLLQGDQLDPAALLSPPLPAVSASRGSVTQAGWVTVAAIPVSMLCPHHWVPSLGTLDLGYVPDGKIVSFGALARLSRWATRRLVLQEEACIDIVDALFEHLGPLAAACRLEIAPTCYHLSEDDGCQVRTQSSAHRQRDEVGPWDMASFMALV